MLVSCFLGDIRSEIACLQLSKALRSSSQLADNVGVDISDPPRHGACNTTAAEIRSSRVMLIRSTPHACVVVLPGGLTLELSYDENAVRYAYGDDSDRRRHVPATQGVWIFREEVLAEVKVGQA